MNETDLEFISEMIVQLDQTIRKLIVDEQHVRLKISSERVEEIKEYWDQELTDEEALELSMTFDYQDRNLISIWAHLQRAHDTRAKAGQAYMLHKHT